MVKGYWLRIIQVFQTHVLDPVNICDKSVLLIQLTASNFSKKALSEMLRKVINTHLVQSVRIRSFSGPYFPEFGLNMERYSVSLRIQSKCGKIRSRKAPNTDSFHAMTALCLPSVFVDDDKQISFKNYILDTVYRQIIHL